MPLPVLVLLAAGFGACLGLVLGFSTDEVAAAALLGATLGAAVGLALGMLFRRY